MKASAALAGGLAGTLTVASIQRLNKAVPGEDELQRWAVGGELFCDTAYYSLAGMGGEKGVLLSRSCCGPASLQDQ